MRITRSVLAAAVLPATFVLAASFTPAPVADAFTQGVITTRVSLPGNPYDKMLTKLDPTKGDLKGQMERLAASLTPAEQQQFQAEAAQLSPAMTMGALMLPRTGTIYCRGTQARATTDALSYHLENFFDSAKNTGLLLLAAQAAPDQVAYTYNAASVKKTWQSIVVTEVDYAVKPTTETAVVAGLPSQKTTYTLKNPAAATTTGPGATGSQKPFALDVWTSAQIPAALNFAHPVYVKEKQGITKLVVYFDKERKQRMVYEFANVQRKPVTDQDLKIKTTTPVLDYAKDEMQIAGMSLRIMLGGMGGGPSQGQDSGQD
ncbi:hypothetical protein [Hymenobacter chitinivorans]|uniref:Uncharacterized protein n=1 Tax=Hymenobacter chitinivorans DSM 11115 TaxID=1121954 RepID=A0A2M9BQM5_9BACT|nr:hypothetical protein [Hymenobacter chitinivorans]PJJ60270.1 hypothetical protein CLV45_1695 [Hymenobacter chitinivorans DSM 11115]